MLQNLFLIVGITFVCMVSPGPDMVLVMRNTLLGTRHDGLATAAGVLTGNFVHITYCALGLGWIITNTVVTYSVLRYLGAAYLVVLGLQSLRSGLRPRGRKAASLALHEPPASSGRLPFVQGVLNNLANPKGALFYMGVFTQMITPSTPGYQTVLMSGAMLMTSALFWLVFVHTLEQRWMRHWLTSSRKVIERVFGVLLISLGLRIAVEE